MPNQATEEDQLRMLHILTAVNNYTYFELIASLLLPIYLLAHQCTVARLYLLNTLVAQESLFPL
jgi:hypothetical protein